MENNNNQIEEMFYEDELHYSKETLINLLKKAENKEIYIRDIIRNLERNKCKVGVYKDRTVEKICIDDIYYITVLDGVTRIFTGNDSYNSYISLNEWEKRFNDIKSDEFYRSHRNYIVNTTKIVRIKDCIMLDNGERVLVSVRKKSGLQKYCV